MFFFYDHFFFFLAADVVHPDAHMNNDCLLLELKEVVNYAVSFFLRKIDELRLRPDVVPRNKTPVNHTPSGALTICLLKITQRVPLINAAVLRLARNSAVKVLERCSSIRLNCRLFFLFVCFLGKLIFLILIIKWF